PARCTRSALPDRPSSYWKDAEMNRRSCGAALLAAALLALPQPGWTGPSSPPGGGGGGMSPDAGNATLPAARNNLVIARDLKLDFGALCDGASDDATAIANAILWMKVAANRHVT